MKEHPCGLGGWRIPVESSEITGNLLFVIHRRDTPADFVRFLLINPRLFGGGCSLADHPSESVHSASEHVLTGECC